MGRRWQQGDFSISEEHAVTATLETVVALLAGSFDSAPDARRVVVACAEGDVHSLRGSHDRRPTWSSSGGGSPSSGPASRPMTSGPTCGSTPRRPWSSPAPWPPPCPAPAPRSGPPMPPGSRCSPGAVASAPTAGRAAPWAPTPATRRSQGDRRHPLHLAAGPVRHREQRSQRRRGRQSLLRRRPRSWRAASAIWSRAAPPYRAADDALTWSCSSTAWRPRSFSTTPRWCGVRRLAAGPTGRPSAGAVAADLRQGLQAALEGDPPRAARFSRRRRLSSDDRGGCREGESNPHECYLGGF